MTRVVLLAHAPLASALKRVATHVYPDCEDAIETFDVEPDVAPGTVEARVKAMLDESYPEEVLILVDVFGATPCNVALRLADGVRVRVVAGVNVPMLWRTMCYRDEGLDALVSRATSGALRGVLQVTASPPRQPNSPGSAPDDQVQRSNQ